MDKTNRNVGTFLNALPENDRHDMRTLDAALSETMEGLPKTLYKGVLWGGSNQQIIGYATYSYTRSDKQEVESFIVGLALQKKYISVYISAVEDREYLSEKYGKDVGKVKVGKSTISFLSLKDIGLEKLLAIVARAREIMTAT